MFNELIENDTFYGYTAKTKFSNNQIGIIFLGKELMNNGRIDWNVSFGIYESEKEIMRWLKRERNLDDITGKCGLEGLLWAKRTLLKFEKFIKDDKLNQTIVVGWEEDKRGKVYKKYMTKKMNFELVIDNDDREMLVKKI